MVVFSILTGTRDSGNVRGVQEPSRRFLSALCENSELLCGEKLLLVESTSYATCCRRSSIEKYSATSSASHKPRPASSRMVCAAISWVRAGL
jgi:hypothetical protein